jgi:hypothetical protein
MTLNQTYKTFNILIIIIIVIAIIYVFTINISGVNLKCQMSKNNKQCENCGVTRGMFEFLRFNFSKAFEYNPKSVFVCFVLLIQLVLRSVGIYKLNLAKNEIKLFPLIIIEVSVLIFLSVVYRLV